MLSTSQILLYILYIFQNKTTGNYTSTHPFVQLPNTTLQPRVAFFEPLPAYPLQRTDRIHRQKIRRKRKYFTQFQTPDLYEEDEE